MRRSRAGVLIAALPMYDFPWTEEAQAAVWAALARRLRAAGVPAPAVLTRGPPLDDIWRDPDLAFAQTCGYPYVNALASHAVLLATPTYGFAGCEGVRHCSFIIARRSERRGSLGDFRGARAAINGRDSNSGMNLFRAALAPLAQSRPFFASVEVTGSHAASLAAVATGRLDIAAIDCVTLALLERGRPDLVGEVGVVARSPFAPGLPYIASARLAPSVIARIRAALFATLDDPSLAAAKAELGLTGAVALEPAAYEGVRALEQGAARLGYPELA